MDLQRRQLLVAPSGLDLALYLVERFLGAPLAIEVERVIEYERRGTVWRA
jgi:transcriptional regulator GlxA family with amidase domain